MWSIYYIWTVESFTIISYNDKYKINNTLINQKIFDRNILKLINAAVFTKENQEFKEEEEEYKTDSRDCIFETGPWGQCDAVCDGKNKTVNGKKTRSVTIKQNPRNAGKQCDFIKEENCSITNCPVDCQGEWGLGQSEDDATLCNGNVTGTARKVTTQTYHILKEADGGNACPNKEGDQKSQITDIKCDVNCQGKFDDNWSPCTAVCPAARNTPTAYGFRHKTFTVSREAKNNGINCANRTGDTVSEVCSKDNCPVDCVGHWEPCSCAKQSYIVDTPEFNNGSCENKGKTRSCNYGNCYGFPFNKSFIIKLADSDYCINWFGGGNKPNEDGKMVMKSICNSTDQIRFRVWPDGQLQETAGGKCVIYTRYVTGCDSSEGTKQYTYNFDTGNIMYKLKTFDNGRFKNVYLRTTDKWDSELTFIEDVKQASRFVLVDMKDDAYLK
ncbi:hypothetical protein [Flavobacterium sp.]|jgi:hypothetical protein|uniref:hypothetical protein n=1 Tax=Flavobacterium sp. TaxID=239 RepID=UPI0037C039D2